MPVGFNLLSSAKKSNHLIKLTATPMVIKPVKKAFYQKPEAAVLLIRRALAAGILADYVLMDTWFTTEPTLAKILEAGLDVIGMVKLLKQRYSYQGRLYTLPELRRFVRFDNRRNIFGQL